MDVTVTQYPLQKLQITKIMNDVDLVEWKRV
jgi:hypothetical protein